MSVIENKIEQELVRRAKKRGFVTYKLDKIPGNRHSPDQLLINQARECVHVEVKRKDLKPRPAQEAKHRFLRGVGQHVVLLDDINDIDGILDTYE